VHATLQQLDGSIAALRSQIGGTDARFRQTNQRCCANTKPPVQIGIARNLASYQRHPRSIPVGDRPGANVPWKVIGPTA